MDFKLKLKIELPQSKVKMVIVYVVIAAVYLLLFLYCVYIILRRRIFHNVVQSISSTLFVSFIFVMMVCKYFKFTI